MFSVSADTLSAATVIRPDGTTVAAEPGVTVQTLSTGKVVAVEAPTAGTWTVTAQGTVDYSLSVQGNSPLSLENFAS